MQKSQIKCQHTKFSSYKSNPPSRVELIMEIQSWIDGL